MRTDKYAHKYRCYCEQIGQLLGFAHKRCSEQEKEPLENLKY